MTPPGGSIRPLGLELLSEVGAGPRHDGAQLAGAPSMAPPLQGGPPLRGGGGPPPERRLAAGMALRPSACRSQPAVRPDGGKARRPDRRSEVGAGPSHDGAPVPVLGHLRQRKKEQAGQYMGQSERRHKMSFT